MQKIPYCQECPFRFHPWLGNGADPRPDEKDKPPGEPCRGNVCRFGHLHS